MKKDKGQTVGKWSYGRGLYGEYELDGDNLTIFRTKFGMRMLIGEGSVGRDTLTLRLIAHSMENEGTMSVEAPSETPKLGVVYVPHAEEEGFSAKAGGRPSGKIFIAGSYLGRRVDSIACAAFEGCGLVTDVRIGEGVKFLGARAFFECRSLRKIVLPAGIERIGEHAFFGCSALEEAVLPEGVVEIGNHAFEFCRSLKRVCLPQSLKKIGHGAFWGCLSLAETRIADLGAWCGVTFEGTDANPLSCGAGIYAADGGRVEAAIPNGVSEIGAYAFAGSKLEEVTIPKSVKRIAPNAFENCASLTHIYFGGTVGEWLAVEKKGFANGTGDYCVVCTDGKIEKGGTLKKK